MTKLSDEERAEREKRVLDTVNGTILRDDRPVVDRASIREVVRTALEQKNGSDPAYSSVYDALGWLRRQRFMIDGWTMASSGDNAIKRLRPADARARQKEAGETYGAKAPWPGRAPRGWPKGKPRNTDT